MLSKAEDPRVVDDPPFGLMLFGVVMGWLVTPAVFVVLAIIDGAGAVKRFATELVTADYDDDPNGEYKYPGE